MSVVRRLAALVIALVLVSCSSSGCPSATCQGGITFYVADLVGSLARGSQEQLHVCLDDTCHDVTVSRANAGGSVFVAFEGVGDTGNRHVTVSGIGALKGDYSGPLPSYTQRPNGAACAGSCALATIKIGADGTLTPGQPAAPATTVATAPAAGATASTS